jgi:hypothetical protein
MTAARRFIAGSGEPPACVPEGAPEYRVKLGTGPGTGPLCLQRTDADGTEFGLNIFLFFRIGG